MNKYINFLLFSIIKSKKIYILFIIFSALMFGILYPFINDANSNPPYSAIGNITTFTKWFPFLFSTIFSSMIVLHVFKSGQTDGTELLISAKPISRQKIILGKFFVVILFMFIFQFFAFFVYLSISFLDKTSNLANKLDFALSLSVGGLIVATLITSLIIIISAFVNKTGLIFISLSFSAAVPVVSFIMIPVSNANAARRSQLNGLKVIMNKQVASPEEMYNSFPNGSIPIINSNTSIVGAKTKTWFKTAKYFDVWYQLGRFYDFFIDESKDGTSTADIAYKIKELKISPINIDSIKKNALSLQFIPSQGTEKKEFIYIYKESSVFRDAFSEKEYNNFYKKLISSLKSFNTNFDTKAGTKSPSINEVIEDFKFSLNTTKKILQIHVFAQNAHFKIMVWEILAKNSEIFDDLHLDTKKEIAEWENVIEKNKFTLKMNQKLEINKNQTTVLHTYKNVDFLATSPIIWTWSFLAVIFAASSIIIYLKRDFK